MQFNGKLFAILLKIAKGERSWRQFAIECDISYIQMRKLALCQQANPPRPKLINKIAQNAEGGITAEDLFFCTGKFIDEPQKKSADINTKQGELFYEKYLALSSGQRKMIIDFIDFLSNK